MTRVTVLYGGISAEREVSIRSAQSVVNALEAGGYQTKAVDTGGMDEEQLLKNIGHTDVVFPMLHGVGGEDGTIQSWLDTYGFTYVGADAAASALCFDKNAYKERLASIGMPVPRGELVTSQTIWDSLLVQRPYVLKPFNGGSSVDTFIVRSPEYADREAINVAFSRNHLMLLEELIEGLEITVGILGSEVLPVIEITPPVDNEFDYENKYNGKSLELCPPQHVDADLQRQAQDFAMYVHKSLGVRDLSRTDMIIRYDNNAIFILETNTIPAMADDGLLSKSAAVAGHGMVDVVTTLVEAAVARKPGR
ncbi:MAG: D-alanine--D-alanine ligase [Candidatus Saccharibacteria bacterium]|nr:D-alanine--D-alanine ligase [Candidatus Saccharibacteria bacterium]